MRTLGRTQWQRIIKVFQRSIEHLMRPYVSQRLLEGSRSYGSMQPSSKLISQGYVLVGGDLLMPLLHQLVRVC